MASIGNIFRSKAQQKNVERSPPRSPKASRSRSNSLRNRSNSIWTTISSRVNSVSEPPGNGHTIYLIRHGEKPPKLDNGEDAIGLSAKGERRAQGLVKLFGKESCYNIGYIYAQQYKPSGKRRRPHDTAFPLSAHLGIPVDTSVDRDDIHGIVAAAKAYRGNGNVLICWEHKAMDKIVEKLGVEGELRYPKNRFDVIWTVKSPYRQLHSWKSEQIERLDEQHKDPR